MGYLVTVETFSEGGGVDLELGLCRRGGCLVLLAKGAGWMLRLGLRDFAR